MNSQPATLDQVNAAINRHAQQKEIAAAHKQACTALQRLAHAYQQEVICIHWDGPAGRYLTHDDQHQVLFCRDW